MPLIRFQEMLKLAQSNHFAVGYFEAWNQDSLEAILDAAEESDSPIILGFGGMTAEQDWFNEWGLKYYASIGNAAVEKSKVPVCFILNEVKDVKYCIQGIDLGFNVVMLDCSNMNFSAMIKLNQELADIAHAKDAAVEAELGHLPEEGKNDSGLLTDPEQAKSFVKETGIDALAVSVGNVHLKPEGKVDLDLELLRHIKEKVHIPLVLHGGSSISESSAAQSIKLGAAKFNVGTVLKKEYYLGLRSRIIDDFTVIDIQSTVGSRKKTDFTCEGKTRIKKRVKEFLKAYNSVGKASFF